LETRLGPYISGEKGLLRKGERKARDHFPDSIMIRGRRLVAGKEMNYDFFWVEQGRPGKKAKKAHAPGCKAYARGRTQGREIGMCIANGGKGTGRATKKLWG